MKRSDLLISLGLIFFVLAILTLLFWYDFFPYVLLLGATFFLLGSFYEVKKYPLSPDGLKEVKKTSLEAFSLLNHIVVRLSLVFFPPLGLYLVWRSTFIPRDGKIILSVATVVYVTVLFFLIFLAKST